MTSNNKATDIAFNPKRKFQENEAKVKFMNFKSQNVVFFKFFNLYFLFIYN